MFDDKESVGCSLYKLHAARFFVYIISLLRPRPLSSYPPLTCGQPPSHVALQEVVE